METRTILVVGGGYAGIHTVKALRDAAERQGDRRKLRIVLLDRAPHHLRKVLLFKPAAGERDITVPFASLFPEGVEALQGELIRIDRDDRAVVYRTAQGEARLPYDALVLAVGSEVRAPGPEQGGIALADPAAAARIRETWQANVRRAARTADAAERKRLLTAVVAGAGISGIETAAELAHAMRAYATAQRVDPAEARVVLVNAAERLFPEGPAKVGRKLERLLAEGGVHVRHRAKALRAEAEAVVLSDGSRLPAGLCVWTLGLRPNPMAANFGLPHTPEGQLRIDASYRVLGAQGIYSIGDCARVVDPATGAADRMTCKEAGAQASRLAKVILADMDGAPAPVHRGYLETYCFGLGPDRGIVWVRQWGLDIVIGGRLGKKIRQYTWDIASLMNTQEASEG